MKKSDLRTGMIVLTQNKNIFMVLLDTDISYVDKSRFKRSNSRIAPIQNNDNDLLVGISINGSIAHHGYLRLSEFDDNLCNNVKGCQFDIIEVYKSRVPSAIGDFFSYSRIWKGNMHNNETSSHSESIRQNIC